MTDQWSVSGNLARKDISSLAKSSESSTVGLGSIVKGIVTFVGPVLVDGVIEGDLVCSSEVTVGEAGRLKANVRAKSVKVLGTVLGDISAESLIELFAGARVVGNIKAARVAIHDGVNFQGQCRMIEDRASLKKQDLENSNIVQLDNVLPKEEL